MLPSVASPLTRHLASIVSVAVFAGATFGGTASAKPLRTASDIVGASLVPLGTLPHSPERGSLDPFCTQYRAKPT
ncbi:TPA: hypothetical protein ACK3PA_006671, partial [Burkholderia cenocepacia]